MNFSYRSFWLIIFGWGDVVRWFVFQSLSLTVETSLTTSMQVVRYLISIVGRWTKPNSFDRRRATSMVRCWPKIIHLCCLVRCFQSSIHQLTRFNIVSFHIFFVLAVFSRRIMNIEFCPVNDVFLLVFQLISTVFIFLLHECPTNWPNFTKSLFNCCRLLSDVSLYWLNQFICHLCCLSNSQITIWIIWLTQSAVKLYLIVSFLYITFKKSWFVCQILTKPKF